MISIFSKNKTFSDEELITKYKNTANLDVLGDLYARYMDLVFGVCLKYLKHKDDSQDAVIRIFEKIAVSLKHIEVDNFRPWLYVVTKNYCLMELRKKKHHLVSLDDEALNIDKIMESECELHPIDREDDQRNEQALKMCIEKLKHTQKESVELFYFQELSYQEISDKLQVDIKKVKSYIQNAKRNLKICMERNHV